MGTLNKFLSRSSLFSGLYYLISLLILIIAGGTIGYMMIEDWEFVDAFYMTIMTVSTVGFEEVRDLSVYGKFFTAFLIVSSFGVFAFAITSITNYVVGGKYKEHLKKYKLMQQLKRMKEHVIVCGYGRVGKQVAEDLKANNMNFVIVEMDASAILNEADELNFIHGDSTNDDVLKRASVDTAKAVITCLPKDADNLYVVLTAREYGRKIIIVSRASSPSAVSKLKMAGANNVIMPDAVGGSHMASLIANPDVMEFLDSIRVKGYMDANVESISYEELPDELKNKSIGDLESRQITGVTIVGMKNKEGIYTINPGTEVMVTEGAKLFVLGTKSQIQKMVSHYHLSRK